MTGYERFLGAGGTSVLPYFGGPFVVDGERRLRVEGSAGPGFVRFAVTGRTARPQGPGEPPALDHLPAVHGHYLSGYVVHGAARAELLALPPAAEPPLFAAVTARRWPSGALLFDLPGFEGDAEEEARRAYEDRRPLGRLKGAPASVRAAYGYAVLLRVAAERGLPAAPAEAGARVGEIADRGDPAALDVLRELTAERARRTVRPAAPETSRRAPARGAAERVHDALHLAGGALLDLRELPDGLLSVRYRFLGERFVSVVRAGTLQVVDAGVCLDDADEELTLESLPAVIREAMDTGALYITARA